MTTVYSGSNQIPGDPNAQGTPAPTAPMAAPAPPAQAPAPQMAAPVPAAPAPSSVGNPLNTLKRGENEVTRLAAASQALKGATTNAKIKANDASTAVAQQEQDALAPLRDAAAAAGETNRKAIEGVLKLRQDDAAKSASIDTMAQALSTQQIENPWATKGLGFKLGAILSMALGAYGQGRFGTPNTAKDMIDSAIRQDLDIQRYNLQNKRAGVAQQQGILAQQMQIHGNIADAHNAAYLASIKALGLQAEAMAAKFASPKLAAAAKQFSADSLDAAAGEIIKNQVSSQARKQELIIAEAGLQASQIKSDQAEKAKQDATAQKATASLGATTAAVKEINDTIANIKSGIGPADLNAQLARVKGLVAASQGGTIRKATLDLLEQQLPGVVRGTVAPDSAIEMLQRLKENVAQSTSTTAAAKGQDVSQDHDFRGALADGQPQDGSAK